ncbi:thiamine pyrophosphate-dependent enzyme [Paraburkholderia sp. BCC1886]|uniref:thiamine pyrophosphate-dependent enzyme n=1 Tax=Paraburkholderia sp. BCC1886 TaxID=2562670 RepID=UPI0021B2AEEE|nr:thiamine pyrophosphate-dependent enzyme [Paraburkholderia sp. BCC1886]
MNSKVVSNGVRPDAEDAQPAARHGAAILADALSGFGVPAVTFIPGEGILELVDALAVRAPSIRLASFRHEAGMAYAAQAIGQMSDQPGICLAARAPGALNTTLAIHTAYTDSAPLIMIVGQAGSESSGREAMLNPDDFQRVFGPLTKWVGVIDAPERIGEMLTRAWHVAMTGRRGPVVLVMPEDIAQQRAVVADPVLPRLPRPAIASADLATLRDMMTHAKQPVLLVGGTGWQADALLELTVLAARHAIPVATTYRRRDLIDHDDAGFIGEIGLGVDAALARRIAEADLLIVLNGRLGELNTVGAGSFKGFTLIDPARARSGAFRLVQIHAEANELNAVYHPDLAVQSDPNGFVAAWAESSGTSAGAAWCAPELRDARGEWCAAARRDRLAFIESGRCEGPVDLRSVYATLDAALEPDALVTSGAGAYAVWPQRYLKHRRYHTQLGPKSGAMGYGLSAAIGAALTPSAPRQIVAIAGDGCLMMHAEELETAVRLGLSLLVIVVNNCSYGAIDGAQRRMFGRATGTALGAVDFAAFARAFGADGATVTDTAGFAPALARALALPGVKLIEVRVPSTVGKPLA